MDETAEQKQQLIIREMERRTLVKKQQEMTDDLTRQLQQQFGDAAKKSGDGQIDIDYQHALQNMKTIPSPTPSQRKK